jgi:hypothetical protein
MNECLNLARVAPRGLALLAALALLAGCQSGGTRPAATSDSAAEGVAAASGSASPTSADPLLARANERWGLLIAGKFAEAYDYLSPGYREVVERDEYVKVMSNRQVFWTAAQAGDKECADEVCRVRVEVRYQVNVPLMGVGEVESSTLVIESWIAAADGQWYLIPERVR